MTVPITDWTTILSQSQPFPICAGCRKDIYPVYPTFREAISFMPVSIVGDKIYHGQCAQRTSAQGPATVVEAAKAWVEARADCLRSDWDCPPSRYTVLANAEAALQAAVRNLQAKP